MAELGRVHAGLPDDLLNFHYDPVACAVALGWPGAAVEELRLRPVLDGKEVLQGLAVQPDSPLGEVSLRLRNPAGGQLAEAEPLAVHTGSGPVTSYTGRPTSSALM